MIFTYTDYRSFLQHLKRNGIITPLCKWNPKEPAILLRHDVDLSIPFAYELAQIELQENVRSTFYFLTSAETYNVASETSRKMLRWLNENGFEVALHFDPTLYPNITGDVLEEKVTFEANILAEIIGEPVLSVSLHNPSVHNQYPMFQSFHNAYDPNIFTHETYLSDSCKDFRGKNPFEFVERNKGKTIQILLHPMHYHPKELHYKEMFFKHLEHHIYLLDSSYQDNKTYRAERTEPLIDYIKKHL